MRRPISQHQTEEILAQKALLSALSNDLALPLLQIKAGLELVGKTPQLSQKSQKLLQSMELTASDGLQLIKAYKLVLRAAEVEKLPLEPVAIGALLQDVAQQLTPYAKQYATELYIDTHGKLTPVLANRQSLMAAMQCLSASLIRAQAGQSRQKKYKLVLAAHRASNQVIATGAFSNVDGLSDRTLRAARNMVGRSHQPLPAIPTGAAGGILIADMLCSTLWQPLRAAAHNGLSGLATAVPISKQLQFM